MIQEHHPIANSSLDRSSLNRPRINKPSRYVVLGVEVDLLTVPLFFTLIADAIAQKRRCVIANHNLHSIYLFHRNSEMREFYRHSHYQFIDSMSLIFWMKLLGLPATRANRFTSVDWLDPFMELAHKSGWRVYFVGSKPGVVQQGAKVLRAKYPGLSLKTHHGYFERQTDGRENQLVIEQINAEKPDILLVGMGMPQQEEWILSNLEHLEVPCILPVGGCFDYIAGDKPIPPRWMSQIGLEWLGRLIAEPQRLWRRYLIEPWFLLHYALRDLRAYGLRNERINDGDSA